ARQQERKNSPPTILRWIWEAASAPECKMVLMMNLDTLGRAHDESVQQGMSEMLIDAWIPDAFQYRLVTRIRREDPTGMSAAPYQQIAKEVKAPRERLRAALESGLQVTALDALFWFGCQRIAAEVLRLRRAGRVIATSERDVFDTLTGTARRVPVYRCDGV
ncbi:helix-turn-helix domain-containing protein, partial [Serratia marcescens]|uniref:helix-turn-helix domain-containing protein n=2 Tax=Serratia TaxID=613 RepID=UPI000AA2317C